MRIPATALAFAMALSGCFTDGSGDSDPAFSGTWEDTLYTVTPQENKTFHHVSFGPGNAYAARVTDFDKDSTGIWVNNGTFEMTGPANTFTEIPGRAGYLHLAYTLTLGIQSLPYEEVVRCVVVAGRLELTKAHALKGTSSTLQGTWRSIVDSAKIDYRINKLFYSFTITPGGKFISHYPDDTLDVAVSGSSFTVEDSLFLGPVTVAYHIANGKLFLDRNDTKVTLRNRGL